MDVSEIILALLQRPKLLLLLPHGTSTLIDNILQNKYKITFIVFFGFGIIKFIYLSAMSISLF